MLNFRNIGYLDIARYAKKLDKNYYISFYNPVYLFIWKDLYKTNIYFHDDEVYFKIYLEDLGFSYFSPFNKNVKFFLTEGDKDAKEEGIDFNIGPITTDELYSYKLSNVDLIENKIYNSYLYKVEEFANLKRKYLKICKLYEKLNKGYYFKFIEREDFNNILLYLADKIKPTDKNYFPLLNMLKVSFEHLYELKIEGYMLIDSNNHIKGFLLSSFNNKTVFIHTCFYDTFDDLIILLNFYAKKVRNVVTYMNIEEESINYLLDKDGVVKPKIEKFYAKYNL